MNLKTAKNKQWVVGTRIAAALLLVSVLCTIHVQQAPAADSAAYFLGGWAADEALSFNPFSLTTYRVRTFRYTSGTPVRTVSYTSDAAVASASAPPEGSAEETASTGSSSPEIVEVTSAISPMRIPLRPLEGSAEETASTESSSPEIVEVTFTVSPVRIPNVKPPKRTPGRPWWVPGPPPWHKPK